MYLHSILAFTALAIAITLMPGPDMILILRTSLRSSTRVGIITGTGVSCGVIVWGALAGAGVALILSRNHILYNIIAICGGLYLFYLAIRTFQSAIKSFTSHDEMELKYLSQTTAPGVLLRNFFSGLMTNLLNPKIGVFYISIMPGLFLGEKITVWTGLLLGCIHALCGIIFLSFVAIFSAWVRKYLVQARSNAIIELICGFSLLGFSGYILADTALHASPGDSPASH